MKAETLEREEYVSRVLRLYLGLAETPGRSSRLDRRLAEDLYDKQVRLEEVEAAMILGERPAFAAKPRCSQTGADSIFALLSPSDRRGQKRSGLG